MKELYEGLGLTAETETALTERIESEISKRTEGVKNDPEFISQIRSQEAAKFFNSNEKVIKKLFGVKSDEVDSDLTGLARQEALLKLGKASLEKNKDTTNQELQERLIALSEEKRILVEETLPTTIQAERQKHQLRYIDDAIMRDSLDIDCVVGQKSKVPLVNAFLLENRLKKEWDEEANDYKILTNDNLKFTINGKPLEKKEIIELALADVLKKSNGPTPIPAGGVPPRTNGKAEHSDEAKRMAASFGVSL